MFLYAQNFLWKDIWKTDNIVICREKTGELRDGWTLVLFTNTIWTIWNVFPHALVLNVAVTEHVLYSTITLSLKFYYMVPICQSAGKKIQKGTHQTINSVYLWGMKIKGSFKFNY